MLARWLWLTLPALGLLELAAHLYFKERAPRQQDWAEVAPRVRELKGQADLVLVAPRWAEPLARQAFGDRVMPLKDVARASVSEVPSGTRGKHLGPEGF